MNDVAGRFRAAASAPQVAALSIDVFDTLIFRPPVPELLRFGLIAARQNRMLRRCGMKAPGGVALWKARLRRHKAAYDRRRRGGPEPRLDAIAAEICRLLGLPAAAAACLIAAEIEYEKSIARPNPALAAVLSGLGKPMVLTSDMYLSAAHINAVVAAVLPQLADMPAIVSSERGASKRAGTLFAHTIAVLGGDAQAVLHVGDDWAADVERARQNGLRVFHWPRSFLFLAVARGQDRAVRAVLRALGWISAR